jgi:hypothetical protein
MNNNNKNNYDIHKLNKLNTARALYIKHDSPEVKDIVNFADRLWYVLTEDKGAYSYYAKVR